MQSILDFGKHFLFVSLLAYRTVQILNLNKVNDHLINPSNLE